MKRFRTFIITRRKINRAAAALLGAAAAAGICLGIKHSTPDSVPAFADAEQILRDGTPHEDEPFDIKGFIASILGFDTDKPETIIESSSELFSASAKATHAPATAEPKPEETPAPEQPTQNPDPFPAHEDIINPPGLEINNATNYNVDLCELAKRPLAVSVTKSDEPEVLIMHTHTTECYTGDEMSGESERTTNEAYNMCAVGDIVAQTLEEYGIKSVHDKTIHDYPSYQGAYTRAMNTITNNLAAYPSVKVVLDIHRDAFVYPDGRKLSVTADINGESAAQVMLVLGTDSMGLYHPYWQDNLSLAAKIQSAAQIMYPGLMRPVNLRRERFNMHASRGSLLIEIGSNGNSLTEAKRSAKYIADALAAALING